MEIPTEIARMTMETFSEEDGELALGLLWRSSPETWQSDTDRILRAILKLSAGSIHRIKHYIRLAESDYRDVLYEAGDY